MPSASREANILKHPPATAHTGRRAASGGLVLGRMGLRGYLHLPSRKRRASLRIRPRRRRSANAAPRRRQLSLPQDEEVIRCRTAANSDNTSEGPGQPPLTVTSP